MLEDLVAELARHRFLHTVKGLKMPPEDPLHHHATAHGALDLGTAAAAAARASAAATARA